MLILAPVVGWLAASSGTTAARTGGGCSSPLLTGRRAAMAAGMKGGALAAAAGAAGENEYTLYISDNCPYAQRSWIAARELGVPFELRPMELGKDNKADWYLKINPLGKVPSLVKDKDVVYESLVINEYLVDAFGQDSSGLMPASPGLKAKARILIAGCDKWNTSFFSYLSNKKDVEGGEEEEEKKRKAFEDSLMAVEKQLAVSSDTPWMLDGYDDLSLVDVTYFPFYERVMAILSDFKGWALEGGEGSRVELPLTLKWIEACKERESIKDTMKDPKIWTEMFKRFV